MNFFRLMPLLFIFTVLLIGCQNDPNYHRTAKHNPGITNTSANNNIHQNTAEEAKNMLKKNEAVDGVQAINDNKHLVIAVSVPHMQRFKLDKTKKQLEKQIKKHFPNHQVTFSTDKKIYLELEQLNNEMNTRHFSRKALHKKLVHIIKLSKEET